MQSGYGILFFQSPGDRGVMWGKEKGVSLGGEGGGKGNSVSGWERGLMRSEREVF